MPTTISTVKNNVARPHPSCGVRYAHNHIGGGGVAARQSKLVLGVRIWGGRKCGTHIVFRLRSPTTVVESPNERYTVSESQVITRNPVRG